MSPHHIGASYYKDRKILFYRIKSSCLFSIFPFFGHNLCIGRGYELLFESLCILRCTLRGDPRSGILFRKTKTAVTPSAGGIVARKPHATQGVKPTQA